MKNNNVREKCCCTNCGKVKAYYHLEDGKLYHFKWVCDLCNSLNEVEVRARKRTKQEEILLQKQINIMRRLLRKM